MRQPSGADRQAIGTRASDTWKPDTNLQPKGAVLPASPRGVKHEATTWARRKTA